jgi:dTDP-4-amino-4,6-dideoxygalactose transaminase
VTYRRRKGFLPFAPPSIGEEEKREMMDTLDSGWITTGPKTERFEALFAEYVGARHALAVYSGTSALHLAVVASGIGPGDEVIVPTYTFASTAHVVLHAGARPVLVDVDPMTCNLTADRIAAAVTERTRAVIPVHFGGDPCDLDAIRQVAVRHDLRVIEDAAHAAGSAYRGKKIGGHGGVACFSFYATKNMTTGEGGMLVDESEETAERARVLSMYGIQDARRIWKRYAPRGSWFYDITEIGFKCNMTDIQASLGIHQLAKLDGFIARRAGFARRYHEAFADVPEIWTPPMPPSDRVHAWHLYPIRIHPERLAIGRDEFIERLKQENIGVSVLFRPLHLHTAYRNLLGDTAGRFPAAESVFERTIALPISPAMSDADLDSVIAAVVHIVDNSRR